MKYHLPLAAYKRRTETKKLVIHCADTTPEMDIDIADVRRWHINERKWIDAGYNGFIKRNGVFQIGRPWWAQAAGVAGHNHDTWHVCMAGGKAQMGGPEDNFTAVQWVTLRAILTLMVDVNHTVERIMGHRQFPGVQKYCPSFDVPKWLESVGMERFA